MELFLDIHLLSLIICHWYEEINSVTDVKVIELRNGCGHMPVTLKLYVSQMQ